jgi:hypothetical protein
MVIPKMAVGQIPLRADARRGGLKFSLVQKGLQAVVSGFFEGLIAKSWIRAVG